MFPLYDENPRRTFPIINTLLILVNVVIFFVQISSVDPELFIYQYAFIPAEFNPADPASYFFVLTSMFMHGGILHILSNMWFLHIFGDNVGDAMGHFRYLLFYLAAGVAATLTQYYIQTDSTIPMIGASGAVSGAAGAYFALFRNSKVKTLVIFFGFITLIDLSATVVLGYWFLTQVFSGLGSLTELAQGGVAFFAHIGGFVFGYFATQLLRPTLHRPSPTGV